LVGEKGVDHRGVSVATNWSFAVLCLGAALWDDVVRRREHEKHVRVGACFQEVEAAVLRSDSIQHAVKEVLRGLVKAGYEGGMLSFVNWDRGDVVAIDAYAPAIPNQDILKALVRATRRPLEPPNGEEMDILALVATTGEAKLVPDSWTAEHCDRPAVALFGEDAEWRLRSQVVVPVRSDREVVAILQVLSFGHRVLIQRDIDLIDPFAVVVGSALSDIEKLEQKRLRDVVHGWLHESVEAKSPEQVHDRLDSACARSADLLGVGSLHIRLWDDRARGLRLVCGHGFRYESARVHKEVAREQDALPATWRAFTNGRPEISQDSHTEGYRLELGRAYGLPQGEKFYEQIGSYAIFPLTIQGRIAGTLATSSRKAGAYTDDVIRKIEAVCEVFSDEVSAALTFAKLLHQKASDEELKRVVDLSELLMDLLVRGETQAATYEFAARARELLHAQCFSLWYVERGRLVRLAESQAEASQDQVERAGQGEVSAQGETLMAYLLREAGVFSAAGDELGQDPLPQFDPQNTKGFLVTGGHVLALRSMALTDVAGRTIGLVKAANHLSDGEAGAFPEEKVELFRVLGSVALHLLVDRQSAKNAHDAIVRTQALARFCSNLPADLGGHQEKESKVVQRVGELLVSRTALPAWRILRRRPEDGRLQDYAWGGYERDHETTLLDASHAIAESFRDMQPKVWRLGNEDEVSYWSKLIGRGASEALDEGALVLPLGSGPPWGVLLLWDPNGPSRAEALDDLATGDSGRDLAGTCRWAGDIIRLTEGLDDDARFAADLPDFVSTLAGQRGSEEKLRAGIERLRDMFSAGTAAVRQLADGKVLAALVIPSDVELDAWVSSPAPMAGTPFRSAPLGNVPAERLQCLHSGDFPLAVWSAAMLAVEEAMGARIELVLLNRMSGQRPDCFTAKDLERLRMVARILGTGVQTARLQAEQAELERKMALFPSNSAGFEAFHIAERTMGLLGEVVAHLAGRAELDDAAIQDIGERVTKWNERTEEIRPFLRKLDPLADVSLGDIAREALKLVKFPENVEIAVDASLGELPTVSVQEFGMLHVFTNLYENAIQAIGEAPGRIEVTGRQLPDEVEVDVVDSGRGLKSGWEEGIGLEVCRRVLAVPGGTVELRNNIDRPGARVTIRIPLS